MHFGWKIGVGAEEVEEYRGYFWFMHGSEIF
jgi:ribulose bisphosphate carboxylase small subunit